MAQAALLMLIAWRYRLGSALTAAVLCAAPGLAPFLPVTRGNGALQLVGTGFVALATGIGFNWWSSRVPPEAGENA